MAPEFQNTIAAIATPGGRGGIGIVRISGPRVPEIARAVLGRLPLPRQAEFLPFRDADGGVLDQGIALFFPGPHSFTGEDVLELQGHGGPVVMDLLLRRVTSLGARLARPGEFSERAFLNDKLDLAQAEAIADLIDSSTEQAARSALHSLQGEFSALIHELVEALTELRLYAEAAIDFAEEEIDFLSDGRIATRLEDLCNRVDQVLATAQRGCLLREGISVVIAGLPNAGKSSLLNGLAGRESAIVTEIPGTTRDVLREQIQIDGIPLHIVDTAGLRDSVDRIEQEGLRRAHIELSQADRVLLVIDDSQCPEDAERKLITRLPQPGPKPGTVTVVHNKIDLSGHSPAIETCDDRTRVFLSARSGEGLALLRSHLKQSMGYAHSGEGDYMARRRHLDALARAQAALARGRQQLETYRAGELLCEELRLAQNALSEITGAFTSEDLLDRIFSSFCIGK